MGSEETIKRRAQKNGYLRDTLLSIACLVNVAFFLGKVSRLVMVNSPQLLPSQVKADAGEPVQAVVAEQIKAAEQVKAVSDEETKGLPGYLPKPVHSEHEQQQQQQQQQHQHQHQREPEPEQVQVVATDPFKSTFRHQHPKVHEEVAIPDDQGDQDRKDLEPPRALPVDWRKVEGMYLLYARPPTALDKEMRREYHLKFKPDGTLVGTAQTEKRDKPFKVTIPIKAVTQFKGIMESIVMVQGLYSHEFDHFKKKPASVYRPYYRSTSDDAEYRIRFEGKRMVGDIEILTISHEQCPRERKICGRFPWVVRFGKYQAPLAIAPTIHWIIDDNKPDLAWEEIEFYLRG